MTGFQQWVEDCVQRLNETVCWFVGHKIVSGNWVQSPNTVFTHFRNHECARCGAASFERGYFNALDRGNGGEADKVPWGGVHG